MDVEVTSVSRYPKELLDAPSAIQLITNQDILRSGATDLPQALRLADNLEVAQENSHDWAISARGFDANLADKLLVLIDGRAVYTPLYGGVLWNVQDFLLEDIDRIEVISGPGGTQWGANAVNGVINVTTKSAKDTQGLYVEEAAGGRLEDLTAVRYGGTLAPGVYYRAYAEYSDRGSEVFGSGMGANDSWDMGRGGFRIDSETTPTNQLTLQGDFYSGTEYLGTVGDEGLNGGNVLGRWAHTFADGSDMSLLVYYDRTHLSQPYAASPPSPPYYSGFPASALVDNLTTYDVDFQDHIALGGRNQFIWGFSYRFTHEVDTDMSIVRFLPETLDQNLFTGFGQDEIAIASHVHLTLGTKVERNDYTGFEVEPSIRILWDFAPKQVLWAAVSRAVRSPSRYDRNLVVPTGLVNPPAPYQFPVNYLEGTSHFASENEVAYELGYRAQVGSKGSIALSTYYNAYDHLRSATATPTTALYPFPYPVAFENNLEGDTYGFEFSANYQVFDGWALHAGYDLLRENIYVTPGYVDATGAHNETADPKNQFSVRSSWDLSRNLELDAAFRWVDKLIIDQGPTNGPVTGIVPSYYELDLHLTWRPIRRLELSLVGQNLLHAYHQEYGFPSPTTEDITRTAYGKVVWRY